MRDRSTRASGPARAAEVVVFAGMVGGWLAAAPPTAWADPPGVSSGTTDAVAETKAPEPPVVRVGGYVQPQLLVRQNDPVAQGDENGFRLVHARLTLQGDRDMGEVAGFGHILAGARFEAEMTPDPELLDAYVLLHGGLPCGGGFELDAGQVKAPLSRQSLVSDAQLQMVEKARLTALSPDRQLGARFIVHPPLLPMLELSGGMFNGEGRNKVANVDENYLWVGRIAFRPVGPDAPLTESALGPDQVSIAASVAYNASESGDIGRILKYAEADAFVSWKGLSAYAEWLQVSTDQAPSSPDPDFKSNGVNVQAGYLLPLPGSLYRRFEVVARFEEVDPNDTVPIVKRGDSNQSLRRWVVGASYYQLGHDLKLQANFAHVEELEDLDHNGNDATYPNDELLVQLTYRI